MTLMNALAHGQTRILLVEDEALIAMHVRHMLEQLGYAIAGTTDTGESAIRLASELAPDLILMDIRIRGSMDGVEAAAAIRAARDVPLIFLTANADSDTIDRARQAGPYGYLIKPVNSIDLLSSVDTALYRHRVEEELRRSEEKYRSLVGLLPQRVCIRDTQGAFVSCDPRYAADHGFSVDGLVGKHLDEVFPRELAERIRAADLRVIDSAQPESIEEDYPYGRGRPALKTRSPVRDASGIISGVLVIIEDISERKRLELALREAHLAMERKAEAERRRLSRELHDELGQLLTAIRIDASALRQDRRLDSAEQAVERIMSASEEAIERVRDLSFGLRPPILDDFGLAAAIESRLEAFSRQTGLHCEFHGSLAMLSGRSDEASALFRILQELLTNIARHAKARSVCVDLEEAEGSIRLAVADDGVGMDVSRSHAQDALGFMGIRERAALFSGYIALRSNPGSGTRVECFIPLPKELKP